MMARAFTSCGDPATEARISADLDAVAAEVAAELRGAFVALLLLGGYARGEGGLVAHDGILAPYNDFDLMAVVRTRAASVHKRLAAIGRRWSARLGIDVDIWPIGEGELGGAPRTLLWLDVALGGARVLLGPTDVLNRVPRIGVRQVPLDEAGRLLANRATGLALSNLESEDRDWRLARHGHKAVLACGDARLLAAARYAPTLADRVASLERLQGAPYVDPALVDAFADAVRFRARPDLWRPATGDGDTRTWYRAMRGRIARWHLDFEHWRVGAPREPAALASWPGRCFPALPDVGRTGAVLAAVRAFVRGDAPLLPYVGHPRERLARVSVALAYGIDDPACVRTAERLMGLPEGASPETLHARLGRLVARGG
jgi:hypothetical protein